MIHKKNLLITILVGFAIGLFIIQPLGITLFKYNIEGNFDIWWQALKDTFNQIIEFEDYEQIIINILFGFLGSALTMMYYLGLKRK
ncbi:hypothetical protein [Gillisia sp. Hel_I_29]|uniref:hypothetical protein n=1 Tax=Gillisia sp. Hel_I_29 TaxID=1249975 RepID=UPI0005506A0A|nr:hypothetical protein [Gillisia sp. Hel_I_29]|tara:strand:+ start:1569 stop:1826 length:258 start_codon:yes stop_codon:yes gene_type:complete